MSNDLTMRVRIVGQTKEYDGQVINTTANQKKLNAELNRSPAAAAALNQSFSRITNQGGLAAKAIQHASHMALGFFSVMQAGAGAAVFKDRLAEVQDMEVRLRSLSGTERDYANNQKYLSQLAYDHSKNVLILSNAYSDLLALERANIITSEQNRQLLEGFSNAASETGANSARLEQSLYGLSQGATSSVLSMEEVKQVTEPLPGLMQKLDVAMGGTSGSFRELVSNGEVTGKMFTEVLIKALAEYEGAAAKTFDNISAQQNRSANNFTELVKAYEQPVSIGLGAGFDALNTTMSVFADNADTVINLVEGGMVLALAHGVTALTSYTATKVKDVVATQNQRSATIAQLQAEIKRAEVLKASSLASATSIAADKRLTAARAQLTEVTQRTTIATRGLRAASSIIGGLPGLLTIAAFSMYEFATSTSEAHNEVTKLNKENEKLNPFANYTFERATGALQRYKGQLALAVQLAEETKTRFKNPFFNNVTAADVQAAEKEIERLTANIAALQAIVDKPRAKETNKPHQPAKLTDSYGQQLANMQRQVALFGQTTELARIEYEITKGKFAALLPGQKEALKNYAKELDQKTKLAAANEIEKNNSKQLADSINSYNQSLFRKASLNNDASEVAKLAFEVEHGSLQGINEELRLQLELLARRADQMASQKDKQQGFWESLKRAYKQYQSRL